jgi:hypothetical protein
MLGVIRLVLGLTLLFSGLVKLRAPYEFLATVCDYRVFTPATSIVVAAGVPWIEAAVGCCLLGDILLPGALLIASGMGVIFVALVGGALYRQLDIRCGCFLADDKIGLATLVRSSIFCVTAILGLALALRRQERAFTGGGSVAQPRPG